MVCTTSRALGEWKRGEYALRRHPFFFKRIGRLVWKDEEGRVCFGRLFVLNVLNGVHLCITNQYCERRWK